MIKINNKTNYPFAIIRKDKHASSLYLANDFNDVLKIGWHIFSEDLSNLMYAHREKTIMPQIDLFNEPQASLFPWNFSPYTRLGMYEFIKNTKNAIENGEKVQVLEDYTFKLRPDLRESMENVDYWMKKAIMAINFESNSEYIEVCQEFFQKF